MIDTPLDAEGTPIVIGDAYVTPGGYLFRVDKRPFSTASVMEGFRLRWRGGWITHGESRLEHAASLLHASKLLMTSSSLHSPDGQVLHSVSVTDLRSYLRSWYRWTFNEGPAGKRVDAQIADRRKLVEESRQRIADGSAAVRPYDKRGRH